MREHFARWRDVVLAVVEAERGAEAVMQVLRYVALVSGDVHFVEFQLPEIGEIAMTIAEELRAEGREQGLQLGREEGRQAERAELLVKQLGLKFGSLPAAVTERFHASSYEQLARLIDEVLTAGSLDQLLPADAPDDG